MIQITVVEQITKTKEDQDFYDLSLHVKDTLDLLQQEENIEVLDVEFKDVYGKMYGIIKYKINKL